MIFSGKTWEKGSHTREGAGAKPRANFDSKKETGYPFFKSLVLDIYLALRVHGLRFFPAGHLIGDGIRRSKKLLRDATHKVLGVDVPRLVVIGEGGLGGSMEERCCTTQRRDPYVEGSGWICTYNAQIDQRIPILSNVIAVQFGDRLARLQHNLVLGEPDRLALSSNLLTLRLDKELVRTFSGHLSQGFGWWTTQFFFHLRIQWVRWLGRG